MLHDALIQLDLILGHQADGDVGIQKGGIARPSLENHERVAILGRHAGNVAGRSDGLSEIDDQPDLLAVGNTQPKIVIEQVQHRIWTPRKAALRISGAVETVITLESAAKVGLAAG